MKTSKTPANDSVNGFVIESKFGDDQSLALLEQDIFKSSPKDGSKTEYFPVKVCKLKDAVFSTKEDAERRLSNLRIVDDFVIKRRFK